MKTKLSALAALAVFSLVGLAACNDRLFDNPYDPDAQTSAYEILATLQVSGIAPVDLAFSGDALWVVDAQSRVLALDYNSGAQIRELDFEQSAGGVAYDGVELWLSVRNTSSLVQVSIVNGAQLRVLNLLRGSFGSLDYANGRLYVTDRLTNAVLVVDPANGAIERSIAQPGFAIDGLCHDGSSLWIVNGAQMKFFRLDESGALENQYQAPSRTVSGLAFAEGVFWCGDQSGKIYKLRFQ
jgi:DNA-binding beta-propeller fold protein YncE